MPTTCDAPPHTRVEDVCLATPFSPHENDETGKGVTKSGRPLKDAQKTSKKTHTHRDRERKRSRQRVVVNVVETNAKNVLSRKETKKRGTANPNDQSRTTTTTTTTKDIYPTALSRPYFFLDTINIVSVYPQLIYTSYPIANQSRSTTQPRANTRLTLQRKRKRKGISIMPASSCPASSSLLLDDHRKVSPTTTTFRRRRRRSVFQRRNNDASRVVLVVSPKAAAAETTTQTTSSLEERVATVPYFNDAREKRVLVGKAGSELVERRNCRDFIALPNEENSSALVKLRETIDEGWQRHELQGYGHASQWPEIFERAECLIREQFPQFGEECEILAGTGWLEDESEAIDWVIRRPEKHVIASKIPFAKRMHRDPDSWTNPSTSQRPREGWTELSMQDRERYQYRFINVHLITSALDPTYNAWQSPLVVMLPRESGKREWPFEKQTLTMTEEGAKDESKLEGKNGINPFSWIKGGNRLTRFAHKKEDEPPQSDVVVEETDISDFEFPELTHSDEQEFVTNGALLFDSFDCWHGAAAWCEDKSFKKKLTDIDPKGRQPFHSARCSIEMRFRVRIDQQSKQGKASPSVPWGPFSCAVRSGKFVDARALRDSEARYDLDKGRQI